MNFHFELAATLCRLTGQELWARSRNSSESLEDASTPSLGGGPLHNRTLLLKAFSSMSLHGSYFQVIKKRLYYHHGR